MQIYGVKDQSVHASLKVQVRCGDISVIGIINESTMMELSANWSSPFEGMDLESTMPAVGNGIQEITGFSSKGRLASVKTWGGNEAVSLSVGMDLYALKNPAKEVMAAIEHINMFASPDYHKQGLTAFRPKPVMVNFGRKLIIKRAYITNISTPLGGNKDRNGDLITATLQFQLVSRSGLSRADIGNMFK